MKFISICSGIEAASVAFNTIGWEAVAFSEIEPFPCALLAHHYPDIPNFGDMTKFREWPEEVFTQADIIVGGPPCQSFSVAGKREGLNDDRGNLTLIYTELIEHADNIRLKHGKPPVIIIYENVPGLLSDKTGAFGCFLGALAGEDCELQPAGKRWSNAGCVYGPKRAIAWRVLDAQYFGLAQRRKRVFVVASARKGFDPTKVLFEFDGVRRDIAPSREAGQEATSDAATSSGTANPVVGALCARDFKGVGNQYVTEGKLIIEDELSGKAGQLENNIDAFGEYADDDSASTMKARDYKDATDLVAYSFDSLSSNSMKSSNPHSGCREVNLSKTLDTTIPCPSKNQGGIGIVEQAFGIPGNWIGRKPENGGNSTQFMYEIAPAQTATDKHGVIAFAQNTRDEVRYIGGDGQIAGALAASPGMKQTTYIATSGQESLTPWEQQGRRIQGVNGVSPTIMCNPAGGMKLEPILASNSRQNPIVGYEREHSLGRNNGGENVIYCGTQNDALREISPTLRAGSGGGAVNQIVGPVEPLVRRLTPKECERLQGFPDNYTQISWRGKPATECPDGHRYKALGNSMAVPVMRWIGERLETHLGLTT